MSKTRSFRDQHNELLTIAKQISGRLNVDELSKDASEVRSMLSKLLGKLNVHLAMEDRNLYPSLLNHSNEKVREMAQKFIDEMGGIGEAVKEYKEKWRSAIDIQKNPGEFIKDTKGIFDALVKRIDKENNQLYKTADEL